jgi:large subunit ribosomal protein L32
MAVPKKKYPSARKGHRRSHHALAKPSLVTCTQCRQPMLSHRACKNCGYYNGREVVPPSAELPGLR